MGGHGQDAAGGGLDRYKHTVGNLVVCHEIMDPLLQIAANGVVQGIPRFGFCGELLSACGGGIEQRTGNLEGACWWRLDCRGTLRFSSPTSAGAVRHELGRLRSLFEDKQADRYQRQYNGQKQQHLLETCAAFSSGKA